jgi:MFS family permease
MKKSIFIVLSGTLMMLLLGIVYSYSIFRLELESKLNISSLESGIPYMIVLLFYAIFMMVGGIFFTKYNTKSITFIGIVFIVLGFFLSTFTNTVWTLSITYGVLVGTGIGLLYGLPLRIVSQLQSNKIGLLTGVTLLGFGLSPLLFAPVIETLISHTDVHETFFILSIVFLLVLSPLGYILAKEDKLEKQESSFTYPIIKQSSFYTLYILFFIGTFIGLTIIGFTGNIAEDLLGLSHTKIAFYLGLFAVFNGIGRPLFGYINDRLGFKLSAQISFVSIAIVSILHFFVTNQPGIFIIVFIIYYMNFGGWLALAPAATRDLFDPDAYSKNYGLIFTAYGLGALIGTFSTSLLVQYINLEYAFLLFATMALIGLGIASVFMKNKRTS